MIQTLAVLEAKMPEYFEGASDLYHNDPEVIQWRFKNKGKPPISEEVKNMLRANFTLEIEFYDYLKQRLKNQYDEIAQLNLK